VLGGNKLANLARIALLLNEKAQSDQGRFPDFSY
jgi:hypothetical protein